MEKQGTKEEAIEGQKLDKLNQVQIANMSLIKEVDEQIRKQDKMGEEKENEQEARDKNNNKRIGQISKVTKQPTRKPSHNNRAVSNSITIKCLSLYWAKRK